MFKYFILILFLPVSCFASGNILITGSAASGGSGGGGGSALEVFSNFDNVRSSPTASVATGDSLLLTVTGSTAIINVDVSSVTSNLNASNLTSGTVPNARLDSSSVTLFGQSIPASAVAAGALGASVRVSSLTAVVTPGTYGSSTVSPVLTFNAQGQIILASSATISGGGGGGTSVSSFTYTFRPETTRSTSTTTGGLIENSTSTFTPLVLFDDTTAWDGMWNTTLTNYQGGQLKADVYFTMRTATSGNIVDDIQIYCATDTIKVDSVTWPGYNSSTIAVPGTAGNMKTATITLSTQAGSCVQNSMMMIRFFRDAGNASDTATGYEELRELRIYE